MLNPFPEILFLGHLAPTLLRIAAAFCLGYSAYYILKNRRVAMQTELPIIGKPGLALVWIATSITMLTAFALFFGYGTQGAAILGGAIALKYGLFLPNRIQHLVPLSRGTYVLVFVICLSLLVTGGGAFAMDLPL
ncbi:hypothetical protein A2419_03275 [Candidatus Adlerbacteria bacterium RIFOXYC1_FULL_48_26]|uniref:Uncharacterized protein n=1 Tax=Candidatus Adlerbacteria bacterium RIFOXYC1_FULL_48_26 TaxID=1797247 RepID=A0A1F4Y4E8_9BACT|nr:MAG: hypothetical protein A2419_03275 [Candidatus Adlerbacteria bacterium RIFOXYC1_FULL_48_26]OGC94529.1 MAG: hypothetical protein A2389_01440 [Candidatus Adlerbacteria bacterium RIFOXYB1_FULL_48_10]OGC96189.1 MAG: hypothetical protein A2590_00975 [Candidatus Adlerbacteria bacterium RIFOXYD1_FULL_48_8]